MAGRKKADIDFGRISDMLALNFTVSQISNLLGISRNTVYRRCAENNILLSKLYSDIGDGELKELVENVKKDHPACGEIYLCGHLRSLGFKIQRKRIRSVLQLVDAEGVRHRKSKSIKRRTYYSPCPNYTWHLDGNHKLIRWHLVVHAGIDGFSRFIVYLHCSNNNRAATVLSLFNVAVSSYGIPIRVRTDYGGENQDVWIRMVQERGEANRPVVTGSSVHNQRIERFNRDLNINVLYPMQEEFYYLEELGILSPDNETDIYCLHYVYIPVINEKLSSFLRAHNCHSISTEGNSTPSQLFYANMHLIRIHDQHLQEYVSVRDTEPDNLAFNNQMEGSIRNVILQEIRPPLTRQDMFELQHVIEHLPAEASNVKKYKVVARFVSRCIRSRQYMRNRRGILSENLELRL